MWVQSWPAIPEPPKAITIPNPRLPIPNRGLLDRISPQATGADACAEGLAGHRHAADLEVGQKPPVDPVLGVADVMSVLRRLAADRALFGHELPSGWSGNLAPATSRKGLRRGRELYHEPSDGLPNRR